MPTVFRPQLDAARIDANGYRVVVASATFNVTNITQSTSLGTISSDANGVIAQGSHTANVGDVIELSHGTYPETQRLTLAETQELAYLIPENNVAAYIVENLRTATTNSRMFAVYAQDLDAPDSEPVYLGQGKTDVTTEIAYQSNVPKNLRIFKKGIDDTKNQARFLPDKATSYQDISIPATETVGLFAHFAPRTTYSTSAQTLYSDRITAGTLSANGDSVEASYSGVFDGSNGGTIFYVNFSSGLFASDDFDSLLMDSVNWEITALITRINNTKVRATVTLKVFGIDPVIKQADVSSLNLTTTDYDLVLQAENTAAAGDVTAKLAIGKYVAAPEMITLDALTDIWAAYESDSYTGADGTNAGNWTDGSGNGRTLTVTGTPTIETNELNGEQIIRLGADSNDYFTVPSMSALTAGAIVQVLKVTDITTSGGDDFGSSSDSSHYPNSAGATQIYDDFGSTVRKGVLTSQLTILNTWHVVYKWSASGDWGLMQDYATVHTTGTNTVGFSATPKIGTNGTQYMKCDIAAIYLFSVKPSAATLAKLRARIEQKYGV